MQTHNASIISIQSEQDVLLFFKTLVYNKVIDYQDVEDFFRY